MENIKAIMVTRNTAAADFCAAAFKGSSADLEHVDDPRKFREALKAGFDAVLLDLADVAELTGFKTAEEAVARLRGMGRQKVVIALSGAVLPPREVVAILNSGANDVISGEWRFRVIAEQVKALVKFSAAGRQKSRRKVALDDGAITVDIAARKCFVAADEAGAAEVRLTRNEFRILQLLVSRKGALVTYMDFKNKLWPDKLSQAEIKHPLLQHITDLRKKLGRPGARIENVWGEGFRIA